MAGRFMAPGIADWFVASLVMHSRLGSFGAKRLGFNKDVLDSRFFLPDAPFKAVNGG
jgi:hypothetical protein